MPIDLTQGRVLALHVGKRQYTLTLKPIAQKAWLKYFAGIVNSQELVDGDVKNEFDSASARLELLESHLVDATGYTRAGESITAVEGWQGKLPMSHRRAAADMLVSCEVVQPQDDDETFPMLGAEIVELKAMWTAVDGSMQLLTGLRHTFSSPTAEHQKRYSRASSRSVITGGRNGKTVWLGSQDELIKIYDELAQSVEGYAIRDEPHVDLGKWIDMMDAYHKVVAVGALFTPIEVG